MDELLKIAASKFNCEQAVTSSIFSLGSGLSSTLTYTIKKGFRLFVLKLGGYTTISDINVSFQDSRGIEEYSWSEYPDTYVASDFLPFLTKEYQGEIKFVFTNNHASVSSNILWHIEGILIDENRVEEFKEMLYKLLEPRKVNIYMASDKNGFKLVSPPDKEEEEKIINEYEIEER